MRTHQQKTLLEDLFFNLGYEVFNVIEEDSNYKVCFSKAPLSEICTLNDKICYLYHILDLKNLQLKGELVINYEKQDTCYIEYRVDNINLEKDLEVLFKLL